MTRKVGKMIRGSAIDYIPDSVKYPHLHYVDFDIQFEPKSASSASDKRR